MEKKTNRQRTIAFTLAEATMCVAMPNWQRRVAFTLAEVLITLGIIGIVAAMTMPVITNNIFEIQQKNQFKKAYSLLQQALLKTKYDMGGYAGCFLWEQGPLCAYTCPKDEAGNCTGPSYCIDGSQIPSNVDGENAECRELYKILFKNLKVIKYCENNAYENGCIPDFKGLDLITLEQNPDAKIPNNGWNTSDFKKNKSAYVLADGTIIIPWTQSYPAVVIDINGMKKPNKLGYDIFTFNFSGNKNGFTRMLPEKRLIFEKGGISALNMYEKAFK